MPYNLLLIPLLGGYIFVRFWNVSRIWMLRSDKDRVLIRSSLAGFFSLIPAFFISILVPKWWPCGEGPGFCLYKWWNENIEWEYTGTSLIAFTIASTMPFILNRFCSRDMSINRAIQQDSDPLEIALKQSQDEKIPICVTLENCKVYIGIVIHQFNPATPTENIAILPLHSGYRDKATGQLYLPVNYALTLQKIRRRLERLKDDIDRLQVQLETFIREENVDDAHRIDQEIERNLAIWKAIEKKTNLFNKIIPVKRIVSVFFFDLDVYNDDFGNSTEIELHGNAN